MPPWLRMTLFLVVLCVSLTGLAIYVHRRASRTLGLKTVGKRVLGGVLLASGISVVLGRLLRGMAPDVVLEGAMVAGMTVMLAVIIAGILMFPVELVRAAEVLWQRARKRPPLLSPAPAPEEEALAPALSGPPPLPAAPTMGRRELVTRAAWGSALVLGTGHSIYGSLIGRHDYQIEEQSIPLPGLPRTLDGYTIVQLSDIHFGTFVGDRELRIAEELVRRARPDLIVLTGDLVDHDPRHADQVARLVRRIAPHARDGVTAIPGNHDYYAGIDIVLGRLRAGGAQVMRNDGRVIGDAGGRFALLGVDDVWAQRNGYEGGPDLARAIAQVPPDLSRVLLCHNPVFFPEASGEVQLQLSGHTHGGQVNVLFDLGAMVLPYGYSQGLYTRDGTWLYVNRGFGVAGPPARVNSPPEVSRLVLTYG